MICLVGEVGFQYQDIGVCTMATAYVRIVRSGVVRIGRVRKDRKQDQVLMDSGATGVRFD